MSMDKPLSGKTALVTGASRGIGAATAEALAGAGAHVVMVARSAKAMEEVEDRIHAAGGSATIAPVDLSKFDDIATLGEAIASRWSQLDILVLNAAMLGSLAPVEHLEAAELEKVFTLNVLANQRMIAALDPLLRASDRADVFALTSSVGQTARAFWGGYGASKAALDTMMQAYADETAHAGRLKVHLVDPGATRTRMRQLAFPGEEPNEVKPPETVAKAILERIGSDTETGQIFRVEG